MNKEVTDKQKVSGRQEVTDKQKVSDRQEVKDKQKRRYIPPEEMRPLVAIPNDR